MGNAESFYLLQSSYIILAWLSYNFTTHATSYFSLCIHLLLFTTSLHISSFCPHSSLSHAHIRRNLSGHLFAPQHHSDLTSSVCWQRCSQAHSVFLWHFRWWKAGTLTSLQLVSNTPGTDRHKLSSFEKHNYCTYSTLERWGNRERQHVRNWGDRGREDLEGARRYKGGVQIKNTSLNRQTLCALLLQIHITHITAATVMKAGHEIRIEFLSLLLGSQTDHGCDLAAFFKLCF